MRFFILLFVILVSCSGADMNYTVVVKSIETYGGESGNGYCFYNIEPTDANAPVYPGGDQIVRDCGLYQVGDTITLTW